MNILFSHSFVSIYLDCFHFLTIMNNVTVNIGMQVSVESMLSIFLNTYIGKDLLDYMVILCLNF